MCDPERNFLNDEELDAMLQSGLPELPPEDIVQEVTPWHKAIYRALIGIAFNTFTLNFLGLNYILPAIASILSLLGFCSLRRENRWFRACYGITLVRSLYLFAQIILNASIYQSDFYASGLSKLLTAGSLGLLFLLFFCLWRAFIAVRRKVGLPGSAPGALWLMLWYAIILVMATVHYTGLILPIVMVVSYVLMIRSLLKLSRGLDEAGFAINAAPVRLSDRALTWLILAALALGMGCAHLFSGAYPMDWQPEEAHSSAEVSRVKEELLGLGFPEKVLNDLTEEDILACGGALQVLWDVQDHPVNRGHYLTAQEGTVSYTTTVYDVQELRITGVAVELPGEPESWRLFHHFQWVVDPGFTGTECMQLWPAWQNNEGWTSGGELTGRLLYDQAGQTLTAPYAFLGSRSYTSRSVFWGEQSSTDIFAAFSLPDSGENHRGYVSYTVDEAQDGCIISSWCNYTHQASTLQYPARTAMDVRMEGGGNRSGAFVTVQDALQFFPNNGSSELIG